MKLGMNMLLWSTDVTGPEFGPVFEMLRDAGYQGVEVPIFGEPEVAALEQLGEAPVALGLEPLGVTARSEATSPISADPAVRAAGPAATKAAVDGVPRLARRRSAARSRRRSASSQERLRPTRSARGRPRACARPRSMQRRRT